MTALPRVSVVLPTYNSGAHLGPALDSILGQTMADLELVLVEDGSTDGTLELARAYAARDPRVVLVEEGHHGISGALNLGIERARAPLIAIMNHDDVCWPERLQKQADFLDAHPEVAGVGAAMRYIDEDDQPSGYANYVTDDATMADHLMVGSQPVGHPTLMVRREAVRALGGYRDYYAYAEDYDLLLRLSERHALANLPDVLLDYRAFDGNSTVRFRGQQALAARLALFAARARQAGRPDPTPPTGRADLKDLSLFGAPLADVAELYDILAEAELWSTEIGRGPEHLLVAAGHLVQARAHGRRDTEPSRDRIAEAMRTTGQAAAAERFLRRYRAARWQRLVRLTVNGLLDRHAAGIVDRSAADWLRHVVSGAPQGKAPPALSPDQAERLLVPRASYHQILGQLLQSFPPFGRPERAFARARGAASGNARQLSALSVILRSISHDLERRLEGLPAAVVKGPKLASLYPEQSLRSFTDIDILVAPEALAAVGRTLEALGFDLAETKPEHCEWKWLFRKNPAIMVEVQTDLVHQPAQRRAFSLRYADLAGAFDTPAAQLLIACVHASLHQFDRLRYVADIRAAAAAMRSEAEAERFVALVTRTHTAAAVRAALRVASAFAPDRTLLDLAGRLPPHPLGALAGRLITPKLVASLPSPRGSGRSWQRKIFWRLLAVRAPGRAKLMDSGALR